MDSRVENLREPKRGCGWRKVGGYYLRGGSVSYECGLLPIPFATCPCCGTGLRPSRQPTWVDADQLMIALDPDCPSPASVCDACPLSQIVAGDMGEALLIWVGERHYPTIGDFEREVDVLGISRRLQSIPQGFKIGQTWVLLAHPKGISNRPKLGEEVEWTPAIFHIFRPDRIEVVVDESYSTDDIDRMIERGLTPVAVERVEPTQGHFA